MLRLKARFSTFFRKSESSCSVANGMGFRFVQRFRDGRGLRGAYADQHASGGMPLENYRITAGAGGPFWVPAAIAQREMS